MAHHRRNPTRRLANVSQGIWTRAIAVVIAFASVILPASPKAQETVATADNGPLSVAIHVSSDGNRCYAPGLVAAIKHFTTQRVDELNASGGINGRRVALDVFDDYEAAVRTVANVSQALDNPNTMAMIGVSSSTRGRAVFEAVGAKIKNSAIPFITEMSLDQIFASAPNVFTMASSVHNELEVVQELISKGGYARPVFVGLDNDDYSFALEDGVANIPGGPELVGRYRLPVRNYQLDEPTSLETVTKIETANADLIVTAIHSGPTAQLLNDLTRADIKAPVLVLLGRISTITKRLVAAGYGGSISQIAREGVPNVFSERLRGRIWRSPKERWIFEDIKNDD
ncbi:MAG: ABC transporter substrate-binding protein, partial [Pseudomonadota bacterium]